MKKVFRKEVIIGIIAVTALAALFIGINFLKGINLFKAANYYYVSYTNVAGLSQSAPVTLNGFKVGQVREINYEYDNPGHVKVELALDRNLRLTQGTAAKIVTDLLGTASIDLAMGSGSQYLEVGSTLPGEMSKGLMDAVSETLMPAVGTIMPKIDSLLTSINALVGSPALKASIQRLDGISGELQSMAGRLNTVVGTLPPVMNDIKHITGNFSTTSDDLGKLSGSLAQIPLDSIADNINTLSANLKELSQQLNDPNSTLGLLTHDPELYNSLNNAVGSLDSLLVDVKKNPKRYISIKLL